MAGLLLSATSSAQDPDTCFLPASTQAAAAKADWSFTPPQFCAGKNSGGASAVTPNSAPSARIDGTGDAPVKIPYLRHPAGGDPVMGDGEFVELRTDAQLAGYGLHYQFTRTYRSRVNYSDVLGANWDHNYNQRLVGVYNNNSDKSNMLGQIDPACDNTIDFQDGGLNRVHFSYAYTSSGADYYTAPAVTFVLISKLNDSSVRTWTMLDNNGIVSNFTQEGYLESIIDPAGNGLYFTWEQNIIIKADLHGPARRLASVQDSARTVSYVYSDVGTLQCITLGGDCTANSNLLASFQISLAPTVGPPQDKKAPKVYELISVTHGTDTTGERYVYTDQLPNAAEHLRQDVKPFDCLPSTELGPYCRALCDDPSPGSRTCNNAGFAKNFPLACAYLSCGLPIADRDCGTPDPSAPSWCSKESCQLLSGTTDPDINGNYSPCCTSKFGAGPNEILCLNFYNQMPDCATGCTLRYQCHEPAVPNDSQTYAFYSFGALDDLRHNIDSVFDEKGQLVVANSYGEDPAKVNFDKVISQQLGPGIIDNVIRFEYHDLNIEAGTASLPTWDAASAPVWPSAYSTPNPIIINHFSSGEASWNGKEICPFTCNSLDNCSVLTYLPSTADSVGQFQNAYSAVVINDLHGRTRVQYLDSSANIIREVRTDTGETTDYNYDANGFLQAVGAASGMRTCLSNDSVGHLTQKSIMPAEGYAGNNTPQTTIYGYDGFGLVDLIEVDPLGTPSSTIFKRDEYARIKEVDQDVGPGKPQLQTLYQYNANSVGAGFLEIPAQIQYPNKRIDIFDDFDPSMGGPQTIYLDSSSPAAEHRYAHYDARGRVIEEGEQNRFAHRYHYDGGGRLQTVDHQMDSGSPWIPVTTNYRDSTSVPKIDSVIDPLKTTRYSYQGQYPYQQDIIATAAPSGTSLPATQTTCFNHSADGRLEDVALPEGNSLHYDYYFGLDGYYVATQKGFSGAASLSWNANCPSGQPAIGDPGIMLMTSLHGYYPGGFPSLVIDGDVSRGFVDDGFGNIIQSDNNYAVFVTPIDQYGYDIRGRLIWHAVYASGYGISTDPSVPNTPYHNPPSLADPGLQSFTQYEYDFLNRKTKEHRWVTETHEDLLMQNEYDDVNGTLTVTDRGVATVLSYDGRGRLAGSQSADTSTTSIQHLIGQDIVSTQTNQGVVKRFLYYDTRGLLTETDDDSGVKLSSATYDDDGNQLTITPAGSGTVVKTYDSFDRLIQSVKDLGEKQSSDQYGWDRNNRLSQYTDAETHVWRMKFTGYDSPLAVTDPLGRVGNYVYTPGFLTAGGISESNGRELSYKFNTDMQLTDIFDGLCQTRSDIRFDSCTPLQAYRHYDYTLDETNIAIASAPTVRDNVPTPATVMRTYDSVQRPRQEQVGTDTVVEHSYTDAGRTVTTQLTYSPMTAVGSPMAATMKHRFDSMGRIGAVDLNGARIATWNYGKGVGGATSIVYANGTTTAYTYDSRLRRIGMDVTTGNSAPKLIVSLHDVYGRDSVPRMRQRQFGNGPTMTDVYQVDSGGRMLAENLLVPNVSLLVGEIKNADVDIFMQSGTRNFDIDKIGNTNTVSVSGDTRKIQYTIDQMSRLTGVGDVSVMVDNRDNLEGGPAEAAQFVFDEFSGRVIGATSAGQIPVASLPPNDGANTYNYEYDALERRMIEHGPAGMVERFVWDWSQIIAHGSPADLTLEISAGDVDGHVASVADLGAATTKTRIYHQGVDQSVVAVSDDQGLVEGYTYSSFGETSIWNSEGRAVDKSSIDNRLLYQGQLYDPLTKSYSMRAREYMPSWGRFVSPDPLSVAAAPSVYSFTGGRPLIARDPSGLDICLPGACATIDDSNLGVALAEGGYSASGLNYSTVSKADAPSDGWGGRPGISTGDLNSWLGSGNDDHFYDAMRDGSALTADAGRDREYVSKVVAVVTHDFPMWMLDGLDLMGALLVNMAANPFCGCSADFRHSVADRARDNIHQRHETGAGPTRAEAAEQIAGESPAKAPYQRPTGTPTAAQRASVQGQPCVDCGDVANVQVADHVDPLVEQWYRTGSIDLEAANSLESVQAQCPLCSARQGGMLSQMYTLVKEMMFGIP